jgi:hypothetical protein
MAITSYRKGSGKFTTRKDLMEFPFYSVVENTCIYYTSNIPPYCYTKIPLHHEYLIIPLIRPNN